MTIAAYHAGPGNFLKAYRLYRILKNINYSRFLSKKEAEIIAEYLKKVEKGVNVKYIIKAYEKVKSGFAY